MSTVSILVPFRVAFSSGMGRTGEHLEGKAWNAELYSDSRNHCGAVEYDFNIEAERIAVGGIRLLSVYVVYEAEVLRAAIRQLRHALGVL